MMVSVGDHSTPFLHVRQREHRRWWGRGNAGVIIVETLDWSVSILLSELNYTNPASEN